MTTATLFEKHYFSRPDFRTGVSRFHDLLLREIPRGARILEIGAGRTNPTSGFLSSHFQIDAVDVSKEVLGNRYVANARVYDGRTLPFSSGSFDACVSYYVLEHIADPLTHLREVQRVLRAACPYVLCTPNLCHYITAASAAVPHYVHSKLANRLRGLGDDAPEPFPTFYRANTRRAIRKAAHATGLGTCIFEMIEFEPCYGRIHPAVFYPMMAYERIVNSSRLFEPLRVNIHAVLRKGAAA